LKENSFSLVNVLLAKGPQKKSIQINKGWIENGGFKKKNHKLLKFNFSLRKDKPKLKGFIN
jgi:hypothetical protein